VVNRSGLREKILRIIPIYGAYKVEEELREWDRSVRDESILYLSESEDHLHVMLEKAVKRRDKETISQIEDVRKKIHSIKERVKTSTYGYFPRQSPIKIKENTLKTALAMDEQIVNESKRMSEKTDILSSKFTGTEKEILMDLNELGNIKTINDLLLKRKLLFRKGQLEEVK
jgi:predicted class III extradiol MEMO1 family dioxygenase